MAYVSLKLAFSIQYRSRSGWARCGSSGMFLFLVMVTEAIWLLLQCDKLWHGWLVAKNFDD
ncbi:hypothetical protein ACLKAH_001576 [Escherichia coli]|nr:hypothetical protein [Escherichia coli]HAX2312832.1 hypothetical protein [Escherichia coli]